MEHLTSNLLYNQLQTKLGLEVLNIKTMKLEDLKKELPFKWRVQSSNQYGAKCVAYIDSRDVQDLLDEVVGVANWQSDYKEVKGNLYAGIGIKIGDNWVWKWDCGTESNVEKQKGEASDSLKRAAVQWGIGRFLYSKKIVTLPVKEKNGKFLPYSDKQGKFIYDVTEWCNLIN